MHLEGWKLIRPVPRLELTFLVSWVKEKCKKKFSAIALSQRKKVRILYSDWFEKSTLRSANRKAVHCRSSTENCYKPLHGYRNFYDWKTGTSCSNGVHFSMIYTNHFFGKGHIITNYVYNLKMVYRRLSCLINIQYRTGRSFPVHNSSLNKIFSHINI